MTRIEAKTVRYIKLGTKNSWAREALSRAQLQFGNAEDRHDLAMSNDWDALVAHYQRVKNTTLGKARDFTREAKEFYTQSAECLWITFSDGKLWWGFAGPAVSKAGGDGKTSGDCYRTIIGGWSDKDIYGQTLRITELSTRLTSVAGYRQSICDVKEAEYLLRRLNAEVEPAVVQALTVRASIIKAATGLIALLHQNDFEVMADLVFTRGGWRRVSVLGKTQVDIDLALEQPTTGERAFVQVKSAANQAVLDDYIERFQADGTYEHFYFLCHSPKGKLDGHGIPRVHIWAGDALASAAIDAGLFDWLLQKSS